MQRTVVIGSGSEIPPLRVDNQQLARIMDTTDQWIRERSGVEARHYVEAGVATSDLGLAAARRALEQAGVEPDEVDLVIFATMTPDHYFPGSGALLQAKLGLRAVPCFDIRQQCVGFLYGLQLADADARFARLAKLTLRHFAREQAIFSYHLDGHRHGAADKRSGGLGAKLFRLREVDAPVVVRDRKDRRHLSFEPYQLPRDFDIRDHETRVREFGRAFVSSVTASPEDYKVATEYAVKRFAADRVD